MIMEIWRNVIEYENLYQVSNEGRVKSLNYKKTKKEKILKQYIDNCGYLFVTLSNKGKTKSFKIHRLVAETFIPNPQNLPCVNHKDEDKTNNKVENLEWCTYEYNNNYGTRNKRISEKGLNKKNSKIVYQYTLDGKLIAIYHSTRECGRQGFDQPNVQRCCRHKQKTYKGYRWSFKPL